MRENLSRRQLLTGILGGAAVILTPFIAKSATAASKTGVASGAAERPLSYSELSDIQPRDRHHFATMLSERVAYLNSFLPRRSYFEFERRFEYGDYGLFGAYRTGNHVGAKTMACGFTICREMLEDGVRNKEIREAIYREIDNHFAIVSGRAGGILKADGEAFRYEPLRFYGRYGA